MSVLLALALAAAPSPESLGSVDGPFLWADTRASVDSAAFTSLSPTFINLSGLYMSGPCSRRDSSSLAGAFVFRSSDSR